jgi:hypothetical protein
MARKGNDGPGADFAARMVMVRRDGQLHAEGKQREQNEPNAESRCGHDLRPSFRYSAFDCSCVTIVANDYPPPLVIPTASAALLAKCLVCLKNWNHWRPRRITSREILFSPSETIRSKS